VCECASVRVCKCVSVCAPQEEKPVIGVDENGKPAVFIPSTGMTYSLPAEGEAGGCSDWAVLKNPKTDDYFVDSAGQAEGVAPTYIKNLTKVKRQKPEAPRLPLP
jgi:hypothetical protein